MSKTQTVEEYLKEGNKIKQCPPDTKTKREDMKESNLRECYVSSLCAAARAGNKRRDRKEGVSDIYKNKKGQVRHLHFDKPPSDITKAWVREILLKGYCEKSGIKFDYTPMEKNKRINPFIPSIDRIDNSKGYSQSNCQIVVWIYNRAKGDGTDEEVLFLAKEMVKHNKKLRSVL